MQATPYHKTLRVSAVIGAFVLLFDSGIAFPITKQLAESTEQYVANVIGISATVAPSEFNEITAELTKREQELNAREAALNEREINVDFSDAEARADYSTYILSIILFILLVLIVLNYVLDWIRVQESLHARKSELPTG